MWTFLLLPFLNFPLHLTMWPDVPPTPSPHLPTLSDHVGLSSYSPSYSISPCELSSYSPTHLPTPSDHVDFPPTHPSTFLLYQTTWDLPPTPPFKPIHTTHLLEHGQFRRFFLILAEAGAENFCHLIFFYN